MLCFVVWSRMPIGEHAICSRRWYQVVTRDEVGQPVGLAELQAVSVGEQRNRFGIGRPGSGELGQITEEVLESSRANYLDHACRRLARVPHRVELPPRLGDISARSQDHLTVTCPESDLALRDDRGLVPSGVPVPARER